MIRQRIIRLTRRLNQIIDEEGPGVLFLDLNGEGEMIRCHNWQSGCPTLPCAPCERCRLGSPYHQVMIIDDVWIKEEGAPPAAVEAVFTQQGENPQGGQPAPAVEATGRQREKDGRLYLKEPELSPRKRALARRREQEGIPTEWV